MFAAQEMFKTANKVTRPEKALILGFMAGSRGGSGAGPGPAGGARGAGGAGGGARPCGGRGQALRWLGGGPGGRGRGPGPVRVGAGPALWPRVPAQRPPPAPAENPCQEQGDVIQIKLSEHTEDLPKSDGQGSTTMLVDTVFEMNYATGQWTRFKKYKPMANVS